MSQTVRVHVYLVFAQLAFAGFEILSRIALTRGTHPLAFTFYRNCVASLILAFVAIMRERKINRPEIGTLLYFFGLGLLGVSVNQVCYMTGLKYTSAIFASAMRNTTPVFTFVMATLWRIEKVVMKRRDGQLKAFGSLLGLCGSLVLSIYRGPVVIKSDISIAQGTTGLHDAAKTLHLFGMTLSLRSLTSWQIGAFFLTMSCIAFGCFLILQTPVLEKYPAPVSFAAFACFSSVIQIPLFGVVYEREWKSWKLSSASEAVAILYAGVIGSALVSSIQSWGVLTQGPVIVAAYQPLETIFTALFSMIFLEEDLHLGSILGGVIVITGLYLLIWGQRRQRIWEENESSEMQLPETVLDVQPKPFLQNPLRRFSCDLETRKFFKEDSVSQRRHSLAVFGSDVSVEPLRRMSSTFRSLLEKHINTTAIENQQLLPQGPRSNVT